MFLDWNVMVIFMRILDKWCYFLWGFVIMIGYFDCIEECDLLIVDEVIIKIVL